MDFDDGYTDALLPTIWYPLQQLGFQLRKSRLASCVCILGMRHLLKALFLLTTQANVRLVDTSMWRLAALLLGASEYLTTASFSPPVYA